MPLAWTFLNLRSCAPSSDPRLADVRAKSSANFAESSIRVRHSLSPNDLTYVNSFDTSQEKGYLESGVFFSGICLSWFGRPGGVALHSNHQLLGELSKLQTDTHLLCSILFPLQIGVPRS